MRGMLEARDVHIGDIDGGVLLEPLVYGLYDVVRAGSVRCHGCGGVRPRLDRWEKTKKGDLATNQCETARLKMRPSASLTSRSLNQRPSTSGCKGTRMRSSGPLSQQ